MVFQLYFIDGFCNDDDDFSNSNDDGLKKVYTR